MIHLGYEVGSGTAVAIPLGHTAVTGQTSHSGKTTTLEALVTRGLTTTPALAFVTKRGEGSFTTGARVQPYFRDRADWQFVTSIIDATLQEKNKFLRPWIMKICRATKSLAEVQAAVRLALKTAKGIHEGVYTQLDAYLDLIVPEIGRLKLAPALTLRDGLNVMDVSASPTPMQMLLVQSALDVVNAQFRGTVVIIPEAWEFIPEGKGSPVKASAIALVRKGAALGNHIWVDSQDMAGVDKTILRGCSVWLIGVQREANEIKRNLANIPAGIKRPSAGDVAQLRRGEFYACWGPHCIKTYVQPAWMSAEDARAVAIGEIPIPGRDAWGLLRGRPADPLTDFVARGQRAQAAVDTLIRTQEDTVDSATAERLTRENEELKGTVARLERELRELRPPAKPDAPGRAIVDPRMRAGRPFTAAESLDNEALYQAIKARLLAEAPSDPRLLQVLVAQPELQVQVKREVVTVDGTSGPGWIGRLIVEGFYDEIKTGYATFIELQRRGATLAKPTAYKWADDMVIRGFLTKEGSEGYRAVAGMKVNVVEKE